MLIPPPSRKDTFLCTLYLTGSFDEEVLETSSVLIQSYEREFREDRALRNRVEPLQNNLLIKDLATDALSIRIYKDHVFISDLVMGSLAGFALGSCLSNGWTSASKWPPVFCIIGGVVAGVLKGYLQEWFFLYEQNKLRKRIGLEKEPYCKASELG